MYTEQQVLKAIEMARLLEEEGVKGKKIEYEMEGLLGLTEICTHGVDVKYTPSQILEAIQK